MTLTSNPLCRNCRHASDEHILRSGWWICIHIDYNWNGWWSSDPDLCRCEQEQPKETT